MVLYPAEEGKEGQSSACCPGGSLRRVEGRGPSVWPLKKTMVYGKDVSAAGGVNGGVFMTMHPSYGHVTIPWEALNKCV